VNSRLAGRLRRASPARARREPVAPFEGFALVPSVAVAVAFGLVLLPSQRNDPLFLALAAVAGAATVAAALGARRFPRATAYGMPLAYMLMVAFLREAEGGASSGFAGLFLVPIIWLALLGSRAALATGLAALAAAQLVPFLVWGAPAYPPSSWRGGVVLTAVAAIAGVTILGLHSATRRRAVENERLYAAASRWSRRLESLNEVGNALVTETDLERLLELIVDRLRALLDARLVRLLLPAGGGELRCAASSGEEADAAGAPRPLRVPLVVHDRRIGVLDAYPRDGGGFSADDVRLAETFAARAAVAVDLSERVERDVVRRVVDAQERERRRIARELHDETGQTLTSILIGLKGLEDAAGAESLRAVAALRSAVVAALRGVRRIVVELRPKALDDLGLVPALERLAESVSEQTGLAVEFIAEPLGDRLPSEVESALYRIVQEGLTNVVKHAAASRASVVLARSGGALRLVLEDDGRGFDAERRPAEGFGLQGMRERVQLVGGRLAIASGAGAGTSLLVEVPLR